MILPILHSEKQIQVQDLIRFDASKSVLVKGSANPINSVLIKPGADALPVEVFNANPKNWFLDWAFSSYAFDIDSTNNEVVFDVGSTLYTANVASGTYTLATLLTAVKTAMEAVASPLTVVFTVDERNRVTTTPSSPLKFRPNYTSKDLLHHIGYKEENEFSSSIVGLPVEYGLRKVTLTVASTSENASISEFVEVYTVDGDALFSEDADLVAEENDIMKWLSPGRGSFLDLHRKAQRLIIEWLDRQGYVDDNGKKITKWAILDQSEVKMWSVYLVLRLFFTSNKNANGDVFKEKAKHYEKHEIISRNRAVLRLDLDGDKKEDVVVGPDIGSGRLFFR